MRTLAIAALLMLALLGGAVATWSLTRAETTEEVLPSVQLSHQLETVTLCALTLGAMERGDEAKAREVLELWMRTSLSEADRLLSQGADLGGMALPNLREGVRRASEYEGDPELAARAATVLDRLDAASAR